MAPGPSLDRQLAYWKHQLAGAALTLPIPADHPSPPLRTHRAAEFHFTCPAALTSALHTESRTQGATLFMTLLAAFQVLLHRLTAQEDIVIGTASPAATRRKPRASSASSSIPSPPRRPLG